VLIVHHCWGSAGRASLSFCRAVDERDRRENPRHRLLVPRRVANADPQPPLSDAADADLTEEYSFPVSSSMPSESQPYARHASLLPERIGKATHLTLESLFQHGPTLLYFELYLSRVSQIC